MPQPRQIQIFEKQISPVAEEATKLEIVDDTTLKVGVELLSKLNQYNDKIDFEKQKVLKPLLEATKAERGRWKPVETVYNDAIEILRAKMGKYQADITSKRRESEQAIASRIKAGKGNLSLEKGVEKISALEIVEKTVSTDSGSVNFREVKKFKVVDIKKVPLEFLEPNETAIKEAMKLDKPINGIEYYTDFVPANYR